MLRSLKADFSLKGDLVLRSLKGDLALSRIKADFSLKGDLVLKADLALGLDLAQRLIWL